MNASLRRRRSAHAAPADLRLRGRREIDADRPPALRAEADFRRSALRARARLEKARHGRGGDRFRAARRRPRGRARTGHHHRRRLPLFRDAAAFVHRRRHAGARAIHPQHGDRRLERRSGDPAGRRAQGPADPDPPARDHRLAARHPSRRAGGQQDRPRRLRRSDVPAHRRGVRGLRQIARLPLDRRDPDLGPPRRQRFLEKRANALVRRAASHRSSRTRRSRGGPPASAVPPAGAMGQPAASGFSRLRRDDPERRHPARRRDRRRLLGPAERGHANSDRRPRGGRSGGGRGGDADARRRNRHRARRRAGAPRQPSRGRRSVHRASHLDEPGSAVARPLLSPEDRRAHDAGLGDRAQASHRRRQRRTSSRPRRWRSTKSASPISRRPCRSPTTPMPTIAKPAPSS